MTILRKKELAQQLYILGSQTQKAIAEAVNVTEKTIGKWIADGEWQKQKDLKGITKQQLLADSYAQLYAVNEKIKAIGGVPTKELYDAKNIIGREIDRLSDNPVAVYVDVFSDFIDWLLRNHPNKVQDFAQLSMNFIDTKQ